MYWKSEDYKQMAKLAIEIYLDYEITSFPIDEKELCQKMGILLLPYTEFPKEISDISNDAFLLPATKSHSPMILYNNKIDSYGRQRFSIFHDIKHYVNGDTNECNQYDEDMADYFSRYMMCPIPILIKREINDIVTIISDYNVSYDAHKQAVSIDFAHKHNGVTPHRHVYLSHNKKDPGVPPTAAEIKLIKKSKRSMD